MPAIVRRLSPRGLEKVEYAASSLAEAVAFEPFDGVYTVGNTWQCTKALLFDAHLDRLEASARYQRIPLDYDRQQLKAALRAMILASDFGDVRFRISVPTSRPNTLLITLEPYDPPDEALVRQGVRCVTSGAEQRKGPTAKTSDWMHIRVKLQDALAPGIYEIILLDENGFMLEGASSNFYAIIDGQLYHSRQRRTCGHCPPDRPRGLPGHLAASTTSAAYRRSAQVAGSLSHQQQQRHHSLLSRSTTAL